MERSKINKTNSSVSVGRIVMNVIRKYEGSKGITLPQLKKILRDTKKLDVSLHDSEIKLALKNAIDRGLLLRESGSYKLMKAKNRERNLSRKTKVIRPKIKDVKENSKQKRRENKQVRDEQIRKNLEESETKNLQEQMPENQEKQIDIEPKKNLSRKTKVIRPRDKVEENSKPKKRRNRNVKDEQITRNLQDSVTKNPQEEMPENQEEQIQIVHEEMLIS